ARPPHPPRRALPADRGGVPRFRAGRLPVAVRAAGRPVRPRRRGGHHRAAAGRAAPADPRADGGGGEPRRRRRQPRRRRGGEGREGRAHRTARRGQHPLRQQVPVPPLDAVRTVARPRAGHARHHRHGAAGGERRAAVEDLRRDDRGGQGAPRRPHHGLVRHGHHQPPDDREGEEERRRGHHARALPGRRARHPGPAQRIHRHG
ncbi:MAG: BUG/TctC family periplasmic protein, partial [uncultured Acetobacteraceae bacterium]